MSEPQLPTPRTRVVPTARGPARRRRRAVGDLAGREGAPRRGRPRRGVSAAAVFAALSEHLPEDAVVTVDVGNHAYSLGRYLESRANRC